MTEKHQDAGIQAAIDVLVRRGDEAEEKTAEFTAAGDAPQVVAWASRCAAIRIACEEISALPPTQPDTAALEEDRTTFLREHCVRLQGRECFTRRCVLRGGWCGNGGYNPDIATCEALEISRALASAPAPAQDVPVGAIEKGPQPVDPQTLEPGTRFRFSEQSTNLPNDEVYRAVRVRETGNLGYVRQEAYADQVFRFTESDTIIPLKD